MVNGKQLNNISSAIHLGHSISSDDNECAISASVAQFWKAVHIFRADFGTLYRYLQCKLDILLPWQQWIPFPPDTLLIHIIQNMKLKNIGILFCRLFSPDMARYMRNSAYCL